MAFRRHKELKADESYFILGIDLGNSSSSIAYFDLLRNYPEIIDISGGYGKASVPTVMQYVTDNREWIFGEYAMLNKGQGNYLNLENLMERLAKQEFAEIDKKAYPISKIVGMFLKELIANSRNINPKAVVAGIVAAVPSYMSEDYKNGLLSVFLQAGYDKSLISFVSDRECVFRRYFIENKVKKENLLFLDFGARELRAGIYSVGGSDENIEIKSVSSLFDRNLGNSVINDNVYSVLTGHYCRNFGVSPEKLDSMVKEQLLAFSYLHRDLLFQKIPSGKPVKLYYNFAYPPFAASFTDSDMNEFLEPYKIGFQGFIKEVFRKTISPEESVLPEDIDRVICTGGGFEMLWAKKAVMELFKDTRVLFYKNPKGVVAQGASIAAASAMGVIPERKIVINDQHILKSDIGVLVRKAQKEVFVPLIERNSFWWQEHEPKSFIIDGNVSSGESVKVLLYKRDGLGNIASLGDLVLKGLEERPQGTTRILIHFACPVYNKLMATVSDRGFGEIFRATDYREQFVLEI